MSCKCPCLEPTVLVFPVYSNVVSEKTNDILHFHTEVRIVFNFDDGLPNVLALEETHEGLRHLVETGRDLLPVLEFALKIRVVRRGDNLAVTSSHQA